MKVRRHVTYPGLGDVVTRIDVGEGDFWITGDDGIERGPYRFGLVTYRPPVCAGPPHCLPGAPVGGDGHMLKCPAGLLVHRK